MAKRGPGQLNRWWQGWGMMVAGVYLIDSQVYAGEGGSRAAPALSLRSSLCFALLEDVSCIKCSCTEWL